MGGDATENVRGCHQVARKCLGTGNGQAQPMCSLQRAYGPWRGRGHAGPGTARPQPAPRFFAGRDCCVSSAVGITSAATFCPRAELLVLPECWRRARVEFSPSPSAYPDIFHLRLELLSLPRGLASRVADFSRVLTTYPCGIFTKPQRLSRQFPNAPRAVFPKAGGPPV